MGGPDLAQGRDFLVEIAPAENTVTAWRALSPGREKEIPIGLEVACTAGIGFGLLELVTRAGKAPHKGRWPGGCAGSAPGSD